MWCGVVWCGVVWYVVRWCGVVWCGVSWDEERTQCHAVDRCREHQDSGGGQTQWCGVGDRNLSRAIREQCAGNVGQGLVESDVWYLDTHLRWGGWSGCVALYWCVVRPW